MRQLLSAIWKLFDSVVGLAIAIGGLIFTVVGAVVVIRWLW